MSILEYNGSALVAMKGKNCVSIAADTRYGEQGSTIATDFQKIFQFGPHLFVGLPGLATDVLTVAERLRFRTNLYELKENRRVTPQVMASIVANMLYEKRFGPYFLNPLIAGLMPGTFEPYVCNMDLIGCIGAPEDFVVGGNCPSQLFGMCESLWTPDMDPDTLFEVTSQALVNAFDRDASSGWGAIVYIIEKDKVTKRLVKTRMD